MHLPKSRGCWYHVTLANTMIGCLGLVWQSALLNSNCLVHRYFWSTLENHKDLDLSLLWNIKFIKRFNNLQLACHIVIFLSSLQIYHYHIIKTFEIRLMPSKFHVWNSHVVISTLLCLLSTLFLYNKTRMFMFYTTKKHTLYTKHW